jgi:hypothetical protein
LDLVCSYELQTFDRFGFRFSRSLFFVGRAADGWRIEGKNFFGFTRGKISFVWENWAEIEKYLGRRREFWKFLFERWQAEGLIEK